MRARGTQPRLSVHEEYWALVFRNMKVPRRERDKPVIRVEVIKRNLLGSLRRAREEKRDIISLQEDTIKDAWNLSMEEPDS